jgi:nicotinamidase/pyrazinamidase
MPNRTALLVVDVQNDFCAGGTLAVPDGDRVIPVLNRYMKGADEHGMPVYLSRDWHPASSRHFIAYGGEWPAHCVQHTEGARFHPLLDVPADATIVTKGDDPDRAGYSAFEGHTDSGESLEADLRARGIERLAIGGLATDYCVRASVIDALRAKLHVVVLADAIAGVNVHPEDSARALQDMERAGAEITRNWTPRRGDAPGR